MQRRSLLSVLACLCVGATGLAAPARHAWAQRVTNPIARPGRALVAGRFHRGVAAGAMPGLFTVVAVDARTDTIQLKDEEGRSGTVHVKPDLFDIETLQAGDSVEVDFLVPVAGSTALEAGGVWEVQR